ncbi:hypothetical protein FKM82_006501 [Ascaphus truei]
MAQCFIEMSPLLSRILPKGQFIKARVACICSQETCTLIWKNIFGELSCKKKTKQKKKAHFTRFTNFSKHFAHLECYITLSQSCDPI